MVTNLRRISITGRLVGLVAFFSLGLFLIAYLTITASKKSLLEEKYSKTREIVETAMGVIDHMYSLEQSGKLTRQQAQEFAVRTIKNTRYSGSEYFWINDYQGTMVMHSVNPKLDGKPLIELKDVNGKAIFQEMINIVKTDGQGFVDYYWPKPGGEVPFAKISYVKGSGPWGWILGTGIYLDDVDNEFQSEAIRVFLIGAGIVLVALAISFIVLRSILSPLRDIQNALRNIAEGEGDLTARLPESGNDQLSNIARYYNVFVGRLSQVLTKGVSLNRNVEAHSQELKSVASDTYDATARWEGMFSDMTDTILAVNQFKGQVETSTESTLHSTHEMVNKTDIGQESLRKTEEALTKLSKDLEIGLKAVVELAEHSQSIGSVLDVISGIAEQTNLLALNAAIEAARAGEQGRGFAVVADEVRSLASRTQASTDEIQNMIHRLQTGAKEAESRISSSNEQSKLTTNEISQTSEYLQDIANAVSEINDAGQSVIQSVSQQSDAVQTLQALNEQVAELSKHVSSQVERNSSTSESLADSSQQALDVMATFKL
ncbi:HAMP domain-containing protein [Marinomonas mediterranea]|uniref:methyl-accepting chemotaxis protein n=1 Tax=Marinomonas mediterranea TaxID=119864 RepID=UPI002349DD23|nr:methyl-accepting chemotaxis protein [Marinomonas mediterranea]WCN11709.1 HAMP domain-containing protein [Marinomonas mediterranea]